MTPNNQSRANAEIRGSLWGQSLWGRASKMASLVLRAMILEGLGADALTDQETGIE
jgi:hypothetical protein